MTRKLGLALAAAATSVVCLVAIASAAAKPVPRFVRLSLLGAAIDTPGPALVYDARQHYFLERNGCSSDEKGLSLLPDDAATYPFRHRQLAKKAVPLVKLPNVHGGTVRIGMTAAQLKAALGAAPSSAQTNAALGQFTCIYQATLRRSGKDWDYRAVYTFRHKKLWSVEFFLSASDQCQGAVSKKDLTGHPRFIYD